MKKVKLKKPITHQGKQHKPGDVIETTEEHASDLIKQGHAEEHKDEGGQSGSQSGSSGSSSGSQSGGPPYSKDPK